MKYLRAQIFHAEQETRFKPPNVIKIMSRFSLGRSLLLPSMLLLPIAGFAQFAGAKPVPDDLKKGFDAITAADAKTWLSYLAGPECAGRGTGQPGFQKAADYVAARFKEFGLKPIGDNGTYFQNVPFYRFRADAKQTYFVNADNTGRTVADKSFSIVTGLEDTEVSAPVVFIRAKGNATVANPEMIKGKILVVFPDGGELSRRLRGELNRAQAAAVLNVVPSIEEPIWSVRTGKLADARGGGRTPSGTISAKAAENLAKSQGLDGEFLSKAVQADSMEIAQGSKDLKIVAKVQKEDVGVPNVVGLLEGSDPILKEEVVAVGGHLDHLGVQSDGIYWGADDDGSGSTAVIAIAKAFSKNPIRPKRSVLFMTFCGEEMGLIGSAYYAKNPIIPLEKTQCLMQMDMVGRDSFGPQNGDQRRIDKVEENRDTMRLVGSKRISQEYDDIIQDVNQYVGFKFKYDSEDVYTRSDHYNFARNGVPIAFQFCGFTPDYHQKTDTVDKINFDKIANSAKLCYLTLMRVGNMEGKLKRNGSDAKSGGK